MYVEEEKKMFYFFRQRAAYEIMPSHVGSGMCLRDSYEFCHEKSFFFFLWCQRQTQYLWGLSGRAGESGPAVDVRVPPLIHIRRCRRYPFC